MVIIVIINKDEEEIEDIPEFKSSMMPSSLTTYEYINLKHNRRIEFICDLDSPSEIYVNNDGHEDIEEDVRKVPVFNEIAAGKPVLINDSWEVVNSICLTYGQNPWKIYFHIKDKRGQYGK